jgi:hypothetical protein
MFHYIYNASTCHPSRTRRHIQCFRMGVFEHELLEADTKKHRNWWDCVTGCAAEATCGYQGALLSTCCLTDLFHSFTCNNFLWIPHSFQSSLIEIPQRSAISRIPLLLTVSSHCHKTLKQRSYAKMWLMKDHVRPVV